MVLLSSRQVVSVFWMALVAALIAKSGPGVNGQTFVISPGSCDCCVPQDNTASPILPDFDVDNIGSEEDCRQYCEDNTAQPIYWYASQSFTYVATVSGSLQIVQRSFPGGACACVTVESDPTATGNQLTGAVNSPCIHFMGFVTSVVTGVFGDPHIKKWNGEKFDFHGECDLVLLHSPAFAADLGLDIHIRTTRESWFSYIETIAFKTGNLIVNVDKDGLWLGGNLVTDFPLKEGPLAIGKGQWGNMTKYQVSIQNYKKILTIKIPPSKYMSISVAGGGFGMFEYGASFGNSTGLMGNYWTSKTIGRDGITEFTNMNEFGKEWQVLPDEPKLFLHDREPQLPQTQCLLPSKKEMQQKAASARRLLRTDSDAHRKAEKACEHVVPGMYDMCVEDVIATNDESIALAY